MPNFILNIFAVLLVVAGCSSSNAGNLTLGDCVTAIHEAGIELTKVAENDPIQDASDEDVYKLSDGSMITKIYMYAFESADEREAKTSLHQQALKDFRRHPDEFAWIVVEPNVLVVFDTTTKKAKEWLEPKIRQAVASLGK